MKRLTSGLVILLLLPASLAWAGKIYKCQGDGGPAVYTDQPCKGKYGDAIGEPKEMGAKDDKHPVTVIPAPNMDAPPPAKPAAETAPQEGTGSAKADADNRSSKPSIPGQAAPAKDATGKDATGKTAPAKDASAKTPTGTGKHARLVQRNSGEKTPKPAVQSSSDLVKTP